MRKLEFNNEQEFLNELDGKVYAISNGDGEYLCDVLEEDYLKLLNEGVCINLDEEPNICINSYSQYILAITLDILGKIGFMDKYGVKIIIKNK